MISTVYKLGIRFEPLMSANELPKMVIPVIDRTPAHFNDHGAHGATGMLDIEYTDTPLDVVKQHEEHFISILKAKGYKVT